jgi:protein RecA
MVARRTVVGYQPEPTAQAASPPSGGSSVKRKTLGSISPPPKLLPPVPARFVSSGSTLLDLVLGGGWGRGRVVNIVGDKSAGKTLLAIEACANFALHWGFKRIRYAEAENAFDDAYAATIGMPPGLDLARDIRTIEAWFKDLEAWLKTQTSGEPCLYVLDSLDSLSDAAELDRDFENDATYGQNKAKKISEMFRRVIGDIANANCTLMVISQIRDNIGVTFGEKHKRSGGKALDFYCSQVLWLAQISKLGREIRGEKRTIGSKVLAKTKKNKIGIPYREAELHVIFSYGVDDEISLLNWLTKTKNDKHLPEGFNAASIAKHLAAAREAQDREGVKLLHDVLAETVTEAWMAIERDLAPPMSKYG